MSGGIVMNSIASHSPRIGIEATAPDFLGGVIAGAYALGRATQQSAAIVFQSAHWATTFIRDITCKAPRFLDGCAKETLVEMDGRNLAMPLGTLDFRASDRPCGLQYGEYRRPSGASHTNFGISAV